MITFPLAGIVSNITDWLSEHAVAVVVPIVVAIVLMFIIRRTVARLLRSPIEREMAERPPEEVERRVDTLSGVIVKSAQAILIALVILMVAPEFGVNIGPLLAAAGITTLALSLGAQSLVRDTLNGLFILGEHQYARGDIVTVAGVTGTVEDITLRRTVVRDVDGVVYSVPNGAIIVSANFTRDYARVRVLIPVAAGSDYEEVRRVCDETGIALAAEPEFKDKILTPPQYLRIDGVDMMNGVQVQVNGTVKPGSQWEVAGALRARLLESFKREGIKTPWG